MGGCGNRHVEGRAAALVGLKRPNCVPAALGATGRQLRRFRRVSKFKEGFVVMILFATTRGSARQWQQVAREKHNGLVQFRSLPFALAAAASAEWVVTP
jgi:hypothetical protein